MTTKNQADALATRAEAMLRMDSTNHGRYDDAIIIRDTCCLVEFFAVARAAKELVGGFHRHIKGCNCEHCALLRALAALRRKLPKGI